MPEKRENDPEIEAALQEAAEIDRRWAQVELEAMGFAPEPISILIRRYARVARQLCDQLEQHVMVINMLREWEPVDPERLVSALELTRAIRKKLDERSGE